jgi:hypothetical protein
MIILDLFALPSGGPAARSLLTKETHAMFSRRHVALVIAALLLASTAFLTQAGAAEKEAKEKAKKAAPKARAVAPAAARIVLTRAVSVGYSANRRVALLRNKKVQEELKLDEKQAAAIKKTLEDLTAKRREMYAPIPGITPQERSKIIVAASKELQKYTAEKNKKLLEGLKAEQSKRLDQIVVQTQGIRALDDPKIAKELKISDEQKKKMAAARASAIQDRRKLYEEIRGGKVDRTKYREKLQELAKASDQKVLDALSKKQQDQFEEMKGKKIDLGRNTAAIRGGAVILPIGPGGARGIRIEIKPAPGRPSRKKVVPKKSALKKSAAEKS